MARSLMPFRSGGLLGGGDPFLSLHREMNRLFDDVLRGTGPMPGTGQGGASLIAPQINVSETDKEIRVTAELPGVTENDIHLDLNDDVLVIRGEKKLERKEEKENFHFVERSFGTFQRALQLPFPVNPDQVQARFQNGVLTITLPKTAQQERSRRIQIQSSGAGETGSQQNSEGSSTAAGQSASGGGGVGQQGGAASQGEPGGSGAST